MSSAPTQVGLSVWLDNHVRDQSWSSLELSDIIISDFNRMDEIVKCFEEGKIETRTKIRVLLSFFGISRKTYQIDNDSLKSTLIQLLSWIDNNERDEWVKVVSGLLRQAITDLDYSKITQDKLDKFLALYKEDVNELIKGRSGNILSTSPYFLPLEFAALSSHLVPDKSLFENSVNHFELNKSSNFDFNLKRRVNEISQDRKRSRPEPDSDSKADVSGSIVIPESVSAVVQDHSNLVTLDIIKAIEKLLALELSQSQQTEVETQRFKVHEMVVEGESGSKIKESFYITLDFKNASWKKTKKTKKIA